MQSLWMLVAALLFAIMGALVKVAAGSYSIAEIVLYRAVVGVAVLGAWLRWHGLTLRTPLAWLHLRRSVLGVIALAMWFYALAALPLGTATTLNYTSPLFLAALAILAAVVARRRLDWLLVATIVTGFVGVVLVLQPSLAGGQALPALIGLASGLVSAIVYLHVRELGRAQEPEWRTVFYFSLGGVLLGAAGSAVTGLHALTLRGAATLLGVGLTATLAQLAMTRAFGRGGTLLTASLQYAPVPAAALIGWAAFGDPLSPQGWLGIAVIIASGVVATWRGARLAGTRGAAAPAEPAQ